MTQVGEISVKISADLAPLRKAQAEAKKVMGEMDAALNKSAKTISGAFGQTWSAQVAQFNVGATKVTNNVDSVTSSFEKAGKKAEQASKPTEGYAKNIKTSGQFAQQAAFQFNDLFVQLASGQSAFTAITQQGAQLAQMFEPGTGLGGAARSLGGAFVQFLINPLNLAIVALAGVAAAVPLVWSAVTGNDAEKAKKTLVEFEALIKEIGDTSEISAKKIEKMLNTPRSWAQLQADMQRVAADFDKQLNSKISDSINLMNGFITSWKDITPEVLKAQSRIRELSAELEKNPSKAREIAKEIANIQLNGNFSKEVNDTFNDLQKSIEGVIELQDRIGASEGTRNLQQETVAAEEAFKNLQNAIDNVDNKNVKQQLDDLLDQLKRGQITTDQFKSEINNLSSASFNNAGIINPLQGVIDKAIEAAKALSVVKGARLATAEQKGSGVVSLTDQKFNNRFDANDPISAMDQLRDKLIQTNKDLTTAGSAKKSSGSKGEKDRDYIESLRIETEYLQKQLDLMGLSYDERVKQQTQLDQEKGVREAIVRLGEKATPEQIAAVKQLVPLQVELNKKIAEQKALQEEIQKGYQDVAGSLGSAINGVITGTESLKEAFLNVAVAIAKAVFQAQLLQTFSNGSGGLTSTGNIFSALISGLAGARASGGPVSGGSSYLVGEKGPEIFTPSASGVIVPNHKINSASSNSSHTTADVRVYMDENGNWQAQVERIATKTSTDITQQGIGEYNKNLPYRVKQINQNPNLV